MIGTGEWTAIDDATRRRSFDGVGKRAVRAGYRFLIRRVDRISMSRDLRLDEIQLCSAYKHAGVLEGCLGCGGMASQRYRGKEKRECQNESQKIHGCMGLSASRGRAKNCRRTYRVSCKGKHAHWGKLLGVRLPNLKCAANVFQSRWGVCGRPGDDVKVFLVFPEEILMMETGDFQNDEFRMAAECTGKLLTSKLRRPTPAISPEESV